MPKKERKRAKSGASVKGYKYPELPREHFEALKRRWPDGKPQCPYCGATKNQSRLSKQTRTCKTWFSCKRCWHDYTPATGTVAHRSRTSILKWFSAADVLMRRPNITIKDLAEAVDVSTDTARRMKRKILLALSAGSRNGVIGGRMPDGNKTSRTPPSMRKYFASRVKKEESLKKRQKKARSRKCRTEREI